VSGNPEARAVLKQKLEAIVPACKPAKDAIEAALKFWDGEYNRLVITPDRAPHNFMRTLRDCADDRRPNEETRELVNVQPARCTDLYKLVKGLVRCRVSDSMYTCDSGGFTRSCMGYWRAGGDALVCGLAMTPLSVRILM
jgi:hypothetical protein